MEIELTLAQYEKQLNTLKSDCERLADFVHGYVKPIFCGYYWQLRIIPEDDLNNIIYTKDFDSIPEMCQHINTMVIGAMLAQGLEP